MRREDIANFLTAQRRVSPLMAFSLLIVAGVMAGSFQLVGPQNSTSGTYASYQTNSIAGESVQQRAMVAQAAAITADDNAPPSTTKYDSPAPENCTKAIQAALGKAEGPEVTSTDKGQSGTVDACFGAIVKAGKQPSQKTEDYDCVGRSGTVTITTESTVGKTKPDKSVQKGQCKVTVCSSIKNPYNTTAGSNCSETPKQFGAGQSVTPQSGGVPQPTSASMPQLPSPGGGGDNPVPNATKPNAILSATNGTTPAGGTTDAKSGAKSYELKDGVKVEVLNGETRVVDNNTGNIANLKEGETVSQALERMGKGESDMNFHGNPTDTKSNVGAILNGGEIKTMSPGAASNDYLNGTIKEPKGDDPKNPTNDPNALTQTSTFGKGTQGPGEVDFPVDKVPYDQQREADTGYKPVNSWENVKSNLANSYNWVDAKVKAGGDWIVEKLGIEPPTNEQIRAAGLEPVTEGKDLSKAASVDETGKTTGGSVKNNSGNDDMYKSEDSSLRNQPDCTTDPARCTASPKTDEDRKALEEKGYKCSVYEAGTAYCEKAAPLPRERPADAPARKENPSDCPATRAGCPGYQAPNTNGGGNGGGGGSSRGSGSGLSGLTSFLGGLMKGLSGGTSSGSASSQTAQKCPTDSQAYSQYQQQYNSQLQQYNYQLQQYNYQQQQSALYGVTSYAIAPQAPQPCTNSGTGTTGQCPQLSVQPDASTCTNGTWRQMTSTLVSGTVCPVWQCVVSTSVTPTAQLACEPGVVESGAQAIISYTCGNASSSTGYGFVTGGFTSGATTTIIAPPENANAANFALKCENGNLSAAAQCTVQIAKISVVLRAIPEKPRVGDTTLIGWVTTGMDSCVISSPDQADFTDRNASNKKPSGIATSSAITQKTDFYLNCKTVTGSTRQEKITVDAVTPGTVSSSIENRTNVALGSSATIRWNFPSAPDVSAVALWLYSVDDKRTVALISGHRAKAGTFTWNIPHADDACNSSSSVVCGSDLISGRTYQIMASLYTPPNASLGEFKDSSLPEPKFLDNPSTQSFNFAQ